MEKQGVIYKIESPTGNVYVGQSTNFAARLGIYRALRCTDQKALHRSFLKYGFENHSIEIVYEGPRSFLNEKEKEYIKKYNSYSVYNPKGLNLTEGGDGSYGRVESEETKRKRAAHHIGRERPAETRARMREAKNATRVNTKGYLQQIATDGKIVGLWKESVTEVGKATGYSPHVLRTAIKTGKLAFNFYWKYEKK